jgi:hypothetical protein
MASLRTAGVNTPDRLNLHTSRTARARTHRVERRPIGLDAHLPAIRAMLSACVMYAVHPGAPPGRDLDGAPLKYRSGARLCEPFRDQPNSISGISRKRVHSHQNRTSASRASHARSLTDHPIMHGSSQPGAVSPGRTERWISARLSRALRIVWLHGRHGYGSAISRRGCMFMHRRACGERPQLPRSVGMGLVGLPLWACPGGTGERRPPSQRKAGTRSGHRPGRKRR